VTGAGNGVVDRAIEFFVAVVDEEMEFPVVAEAGCENGNLVDVPELGIFVNLGVEKELYHVFLERESEKPIAFCLDLGTWILNVGE
jgi:hypothetical protein